MGLHYGPSTLAPLKAFIGRIARGAKFYRKLAEHLRDGAVAHRFEAFASDLDDHVARLSRVVVASGGAQRRPGYDTDPDLQDGEGDSALVDRMIAVERSIIEQARDLVDIARDHVELVTAVQRCASTALAHSTWLLQVRLELLPDLGGAADLGSRAHLLSTSDDSSRPAMPPSSRERERR